MSPPQKPQSIIDLQTAISDVEQLLLTYQQTHASYVTDLQSGLHTESKVSLAKLKSLNERIESRLAYIQETSKKLQHKKSQYRSDITTNDGDIAALIEQIRKNSRELQNLDSRQHFQKKEVETTKLLADSNYYHLVGFFIIYAIVAYHLIKTFTTEDSGRSETIILILGISIFIYYFVDNLF